LATATTYAAWGEQNKGFTANTMIGEAHAAAGWTISERVRQFRPRVDTILGPFFAKAGAVYPPKKAVLLGLKEEKRLEVYAPDAKGGLVFVKAYPIVAMSGGLGPKLRQGDMQAPEGIYGIEYLNPNSSFHLSMKIDYPNAFDRRKATSEKRKNLGGDIMIHGSFVSIGCLAMGDAAIEELFILVARVGIKNIKVVLSPIDFRLRSDPGTSCLPSEPGWIQELYDGIRLEMKELPAPSSHTALTTESSIREH
jgi:hypothetical protein